MKWLKRWHKIGYKELWHLHYGGAHEGDKGCQREYDFLFQIMSGWKGAYESERSLRLEAERTMNVAPLINAYLKTNVYTNLYTNEDYDL